jgi:hypothetical protein
MWELASYYQFYLAALQASVQLAVVLSLLVSADRILSILKLGFIKLRAKVTGRLPKDDYFCAPLPKNAADYPLVREARQG